MIKTFTLSNSRSARIWTDDDVPGTSSDASLREREAECAGMRHVLRSALGLELLIPHGERLSYGMLCARVVGMSETHVNLSLGERLIDLRPSVGATLALPPYACSAGIASHYHHAILQGAQAAVQQYACFPARLQFHVGAQGDAVPELFFRRLAWLCTLLFSAPEARLQQQLEELLALCWGLDQPALATPEDWRADHSERELLLA